MPRGRRRRSVGASALAIVRQAREAAKSALASLRREIQQTRTRLETLLGEERSFRFDILGGPRRGPGRPRKARKPGRRARRRAAAPRRKGPPRAEAFFKRLPASFSIDTVRRIAGKRAAISLAQWSRAKRIRKTASGYTKTGK